MPFKRTRSIADRFWSKVRKLEGPDACWVWTASRDKHGYGRFAMGREAEPSVWAAHRVAWMLEHNYDPGSRAICHKCDNPPCVRPSHLFRGTMEDNQQDMSRKGRAATGDKHGLHLHPKRTSRGADRPKAKLTEADVLSMRKQYARGGISYKSIAVEFFVSEMAAYNAINRRTWKHI